LPSGAKDYGIFKEFKALNLSERLPYFSSHLTARNCFRCSRTNFNGRTNDIFRLRRAICKVEIYLEGDFALAVSPATRLTR
jgi:hypothetical protein